MSLACRQTYLYIFLNSLISKKVQLHRIFYLELPHLFFGGAIISGPFSQGSTIYVASPHTFTVLCLKYAACCIFYFFFIFYFTLSVVIVMVFTLFMNCICNYVFERAIYDFLGSKIVHCHYGKAAALLLCKLHE